MKYAIIRYPLIEGKQLETSGLIKQSNTYCFVTEFYEALIKVSCTRYINNYSDEEFCYVYCKEVLAYTGSTPPKEGLPYPDPLEVFEAETDDDAKLFFEMRED